MEKDRRSFKTVVFITHWFYSIWLHELRHEKLPSSHSVEAPTHPVSGAWALGHRHHVKLQWGSVQAQSQYFSDIDSGMCKQTAVIVLKTFKIRETSERLLVLTGFATLGSIKYLYPYAEAAAPKIKQITVILQKSKQNPIDSTTLIVCWRSEYYPW